MADALIDIVGPEELPAIVKLYNQIFGRRGTGVVPTAVSRPSQRAANGGAPRRPPVGFSLGFELKPNIFFSWFYGVLPECRRQGIASQLMEAVHSWRGSMTTIRFASSVTTNIGRCCTCDRAGIRHRRIRWDPDRNANLVLFQKVLRNDDASLILN